MFTAGPLACGWAARAQVFAGIAFAQPPSIVAALDELIVVSSYGHLLRFAPVGVAALLRAAAATDAAALKSVRAAIKLASVSVADSFGRATSSLAVLWGARGTTIALGGDGDTCVVGLWCARSSSSSSSGGGSATAAAGSTASAAASAAIVPVRVAAAGPDVTRGSPVVCVRLTDDGGIVVAATRDGRVCILRVASPDTVPAAAGGTGGLHLIAIWSPQMGRTLVDVAIVPPAQSAGSSSSTRLLFTALLSVAPHGELTVVECDERAAISETASLRVAGPCASGRLTAGGHVGHRVYVAAGGIVTGSEEHVFIRCVCVSVLARLLGVRPQWQLRAAYHELMIVLRAQGARRELASSACGRDGE